MEMLATMLVVQNLHRRWEQGPRLLPDPGGSIGNDTQADLLLGNQPGRLDLSERFRRLRIRLDLMPAQHLDHPVGGEQVEPEPFGFPPLLRPPDPLRPSVLAPWPPAFRRFWAGRYRGAVNRQHENRPPGLPLRHGRDLGNDLLPAG